MPAPRRIPSAALAFAVLLFSIASASANAQPANDLSAFLGRWQVNLAKTKLGRNGPNSPAQTRDPAYTYAFAPEGNGLRMDVYAKYSPDATPRSSPIVADNKLHPCQVPTGCQNSPGNPADQSSIYTPIDQHMFTRVFFSRGKPIEYSTYSVSADGKTFTMINWSPETPEYQNIQVFDKQP